MDTHVKVAAWLRIVGSAVYLLIALVVMIAYGGASIVIGAAGGHDAAGALPALTVIVVCISMFFGILALPGLIIGWGLLKYRPWARILNIVISILELFNIPVGTAIGAYSLWVMFHPETAALFEGQVPPGTRSIFDHTWAGRGELMEGHVRAAAWLRIVWSTVGLLLTLSGLLFFRSTGMPLIREVTRSVVQGQGTAGGSPEISVDDLAELVMRSVTVVFIVIFVLEIPALIVGWGLLRYRPWARPLNIACSIFDLFSIPVGTAVGAYSLWVMFRPETAALFRNPPGSGPALL